MAVYRREFQPSAQLDAPHVIAGVNVIAADSAAEAQEMFQATKRARVSLFFGSGRVFTDDEADMILDSPQGQHVAQMMKYSAVGTPDAVLRLPRGVHGARRRRRTDRGAPEHRHRSPAALRGASGGGRRAGKRLIF